MKSLSSAVRICAALIGTSLLIAGCVVQAPPQGGRPAPQPSPSPGPVVTPKPQKKVFVPAVYRGRYGCKGAYGRRAFFDRTKPRGGGCWVCPRSNPQRTVFPVNGKRACQPRGTIISVGGVRARYLGKRCKGRAFKQPGANRCYICPRSYRPHNIRVNTDLRQVNNACRLQRR